VAAGRAEPASATRTLSRPGAGVLPEILGAALSGDFAFGFAGGLFSPPALVGRISSVPRERLGLRPNAGGVRSSLVRRLGIDSYH
jgi:hypothetical protein